MQSILLQRPLSNDPRFIQYTYCSVLWKLTKLNLKFYTQGTTCIKDIDTSDIQVEKCRRSWQGSGPTP